MQSSQGQTQTPSMPSSMQSVPELPPELNPALQQNSGGAGGPTLDQIRAIVSPIAARTRGIPDGGFQPPQTLPNPKPAQNPAPNPAPEVPAAPAVASEDTEAFGFDVDISEDKTSDETAEPIEETNENGDKEDDKTDEKDDLPTDPKAENFKALRTKVKEVKTELETERAERERLQRELEEYKTGAALPDVIKEKEDRIAQLEPLEHLHALRTSRHYHEKYIKPLSELQEKLKNLAVEYEVSPEDMQEASRCTTQAELNRWLTEHFDPLGAQDARDIIRQVQTLQSEAQAAEKEPKTALNRIIEEARAAEAEAERTSFETVHTSSRRGWVSALAAHKQANILPELIFKEGDEHHNNTFVKPILTKAGAEYGKIVKQLFESGLRKLPDDLAFALANACQLAYATSVRGKVHDQVIQHAEALAADAAAARKFNRPGVGSTSGMSSTPLAAPERMTPEDAAKRSREQAMSRTRK